MGRQSGPGSGQRFGRDPGQGRAITAVLTPSTLPAALSVLRIRLAALLAAQLFDYGTFTVMVARHGIETEMNPLIARGFMIFGLPLLIAGKTAVIVIIGSILVILGRNWGSATTNRRLATTIALLAVAGGLVGGISNILVS